jgi:16S rRNA (cytidine1402-2'-O)-methyltransferase
MPLGTLFVVATPIGNLEDITRRALAVLKEVDVIACEDTRHSRKLLNHYVISTPQISLHEHNEQTQTRHLLARLQEGESVALIADAGTPLISDPGYHLVATARQSGIKVSPIPGPSALIAALSVAGLPTDRFVYEGFLPAKSVARRKRLHDLARETRTLVFYESSHRIIPCLGDMCDCLGESRAAAIARELTKAFENLRTGSLDELRSWVQADPDNRRGEFVILVKGASKVTVQSTDEEVKRILTILLTEVALNTAVRLAVQLTGERKNRVYQLALTL